MSNSIQKPYQNRNFVPLRGRSRIVFPNAYCVVDIETTGLRPVTDHIIEIGAISYVNGQETDRFQSLLQPPMTYWGTYVDPYITQLTGITDEMLSTAPESYGVLEQFREFLGDQIIVGYNVGFDVGFLYREFSNELGYSMANDYIDALRIARRLYPEMQHHRLADMVDRFGLVNEHAHRALYDVEVTAACFERMREEAVLRNGSEEAFLQSFCSRGAGGSASVRAADILGNPEMEDPNSPFYRRSCVFTGKFSRFTHKGAMQQIADIGGVNEDYITEYTSYLIVAGSRKGAKSSKERTAEEMIGRGCGIQILYEEEFYEMLDGQQRFDG